MTRFSPSSQTVSCFETTRNLNSVASPDGATGTEPTQTSPSVHVSAAAFSGDHAPSEAADPTTARDAPKFSDACSAKVTVMSPPGADAPPSAVAGRREESRAGRDARRRARAVGTGRAAASVARASDISDANDDDVRSAPTTIQLLLNGRNPAIVVRRSRELEARRRPRRTLSRERGTSARRKGQVLARARRRVRARWR